MYNSFASIQRKTTSPSTGNRQRSILCCLTLFIFTIATHIQSCTGHGRLIEPPSRATAWRYGFNTPPDYNDHELYCGGFTRQWKRNDGKCGECGDAWDASEPRAHEYGGQWGQGVIVRKYGPGSEMTIRVELTASHMGYFEFRLCPEPDAKQDCLDRHLLKILSGSPAVPAPNDLETRFYPRNGSRIYEMKAQLPDIKCNQCMLQWRYIAGNNWGICPDGNGAVGCGPQEEFRACSDIALGEGANTPILPPKPRPTARTSVRPKTSTDSTTRQEADQEGFNYVPLLTIGILLFLVLCAVAIWYLYRYHGEKVKTWVETTGERFCQRQKQIAAVRTTKSIPPKPIITSMTAVAAAASMQQHSGEKSMDDKNSILSCSPPVPPPRTKRQSRVKELSPDESSIA